MHPETNARYFSVSADCWKLGLRSAAIVFRNVCVTESSPELRAEMATGIATLQAEGRGILEILGKGDCLEVGYFKELLRKVGVNPKREQPSLERLLKFARKRGSLPAINSLVDAYNLVSIRSKCSLGAHDLDRITLPVALRFMTGTETFVPLGAAHAEPVTPGEYAYVDAEDRVLCRLDILQADLSKVTTATTNVLLIVEATARHAADVHPQAVEDVIALVTRHCGGSAEIVALPYRLG